VPLSWTGQVLVRTPRDPDAVATAANATTLAIAAILSTDFIRTPLRDADTARHLGTSLDVSRTDRSSDRTWLATPASPSPPAGHRCFGASIPPSEAACQCTV